MTTSSLEVILQTYIVNGSTIPAIDKPLLEDETEILPSIVFR